MLSYSDDVKAGMEGESYSAPAESVPLWAGPAPRRPGQSGAGAQVVWDHIAARHPRKFRRALAYVRWLDRMYAKYDKKVL